MRVVVTLLLLGCEGEPVVETRADAQPDTSTSVEGGACDDVEGNLVPNGSFEGAGGTGNWASPLEAVNGGADHCTTWAKLSTTRIWDATSLRIPVSGAVGDVFEFGASVQRLDDEITEIDVFLLTPESDPATHRPTPVPTKSTWVRVTGTLQLNKPVDSLTIGVGANVDKLRALGIDRVWLRRQPK